MKGYSELTIELSPSVRHSHAFLPVITEDDSYKCWYWSKKGRALPFNFSLLKAQGLKDLLPLINDHFVLVLLDKDTGLFQVANDRFSSYPLYYVLASGTLHLSTIFSSLFTYSEKRIDEGSVLQFFHYQRLFGESSFLRDIKFLESATILTWQVGGTDLLAEKYWLPSFRKRKDDLEATSAVFAEVLRKASGSYNPGSSILLSGGLDSRVTLATSPVSRALTLGEVKGLEFKVAEKLATIKQVPITFVPRNDALYFEKRQTSSRLGGGMLNIMHSHFFSIAPYAQDHMSLHHGHGFDYLFQGMYLPQRKKMFLGKKSLRAELIRPKDVSAHYLSQVKFKMKSVSLNSICRPGLDVNKALIAPLSELSSIFQEKIEHDDSLDLWEFFTINNLSRHYTGLNLRSMEQSSRQLTFAWDNDIFDLYLSIPHEYKLNGRLLKRALLLINPAIAKTINANVNLPAHWGGPILSAGHLTGLLLNKLGLKTFGPPPKVERSWPDMNEILRTPDWKGHLLQLVDGGRWKRMNLFDAAKVSQVVLDHLDGKINAYDFIFSLVTLELFLEDLWA